MNCQQIEPWISAYSDGELDTRRRQIVQEHLARCPDCRALSREWETLARELRAGLNWSDAPEGLHARVMRQIPEPKAVPVRAGHAGFWRTRPRLSLALMPLAAAAAWLLVLPHSMHPAPQPIGRGGDLILVTVTPSSRLTQHVTIPNRGLDPSIIPVSSRKTGANPAANNIRRVPGGTPAGLAQRRRSPGRSEPETELHRQMRQLRRPRRRYPIAELFLPEWRPTRRHRRELMTQPREAQVTAAKPTIDPASPRVTVVEYVLPQVEPQLPAEDAGTEYVLPPAEPGPASDSGVAL